MYYLCYIYLIIYKSKQEKEGRRDRLGRERTRAKDAAAIFARPLPLFCSVCCPHRPHHRQRSPSRPLTLSQKGREGRPPRPRPLPLRQVVKVGQRARQGGRSLPLTLPTLSTLPGCVRIYAETSEEGEGCAKPYQGGEDARRESLFRDFLRGCIALNINYLISPLGYAVQCQYIGEMVIVLKVKKITN